MTIDIDDSMMLMVVTSNYPVELNILLEELTCEMNNAYMLKKIGSVKNTARTFFDQLTQTIPIGLWIEVLKICKRRDIHFDLTPAMTDYINQYQFGFDLFKKYVDKTFDGAIDIDKGHPLKPYDYQVTAAYNLLKYRFCCGEISTSAGKTLISFIIFKYLVDIEKVNKILYIVPSVDLATQSAEKYEYYEKCLKHHNHNWEIGILTSKLKKKEREKVESCNILFGTFQSLNKRNSEFFEKFNACISDECHHNSNKSIKNVLHKCPNLKYSIGVTGTFPKEKTFDYYMIQSIVGPLVYKYTSNQLINEDKRGTPIYIVMQYLNWAKQSEKQDMWYLRMNKDPNDISAGSKVLKHENALINNSYTRLKYIADMAIKTKKNTLVLFGDVKGGYGKRIYQYIKDNSDKDVYYVDGTTPSENRQWMTEQMENDLEGNTVMVASIGTMGEGIDLKNLWSIFLVNTSKSERIIRQICGRGLRLFKGKDKVVMFDFVDDLRYTETGKQNENYSYKHSKDRKKIYLEQKFPVYEQKINFDI